MDIYIYRERESRFHSNFGFSATGLGIRCKLEGWGLML